MIAKQPKISTSNTAIAVTTNSGNKIIIDDCFLEYFDLISSLLGIDKTYKEFSQMDKSDREAFVKGIKRSIKIEKLDI